MTGSSTKSVTVKTRQGLVYPACLISITQCLRYSFPAKEQCWIPEHCCISLFTHSVVCHYVLSSYSLSALSSRGGYNANMS